MGRLFQISRHWICEIEKLFFMGLIFSIVWPVLLDENKLVFSYYFMIMIIYATLQPCMLLKNGAGTVISVGGRRCDIFWGTLIADIVFCLQSTIFYWILMQFGGRNQSGVLWIFTLCFLAMQGLGYVMGCIAKKIGKIATVIFIVIVGIGASALMISIISLYGTDGVNDIVSQYVFIRDYGGIIAGVCVAVSVIGRVLGYIVIKDYEVLV